MNDTWLGLGFIALMLLAVLVFLFANVLAGPHWLLGTLGTVAIVLGIVMLVADVAHKER